MNIDQPQRVAAKIADVGCSRFAGAMDKTIAGLFRAKLTVWRELADS